MSRVQTGHPPVDVNHFGSRIDELKPNRFALCRLNVACLGD